MFGDLNSLPPKITVREVGPRDGLQNEPVFVPTSAKIDLVNALSATGVTSIQVTSMVHPKAVPQLADAELLMAGIQRPAGVEFAILVPNMKGAERAKGANADEWSIMLSASEQHSRVNANASLDEALLRVAEIAEFGRASGVRLRGGMSMALGCPFEGRIPHDRLVKIVQAYLAAGVTEVGMADTAGVASPLHVYETCSRMIEQFPDVTFKLHLHDTRGLAMTNVLAGMMAGITIFDSSVGGLGGCPFVPNATGNLATEDLVHFCDLMGIETGLNLARLIEIAHGLPALVGHDISSKLALAGPADRLVDIALAKVARG